MDYKQVNSAVYNQYAREFEDRTKDYTRIHLMEDVEFFISSLAGKNILDLGSGPGRDSALFKERGLEPTCLDISSEMVKLCKERGLKAVVGDLENLPFADNLFDGVWAYTSLLHVPKNNFPQVLKKIKDILKPNGVFYLGMKEGNFEGMVGSDKYGKSQRFFSLYTDGELKSALTTHFEIIKASSISLGESTFLNYLCRRRN